MIDYEIAVLYDPDLEVDLDKAEASFKKIIGSRGGKITATDNWGKRHLAYPIKKHDSAVYVFYTVQLDPSELAGLDRELNITSEVIRFLVTRPDPKKLARAEAERVDKLKKNADRTTRDEEEKTNE